MSCMSSRVLCRKYIMNIMRSSTGLLSALALVLFSCWPGQFVEASNEEGIKFLEANKNEPGIVTLPSGLQYKVLQKGDGHLHPAADTPCSCHYAGTLIDGTPFDSSIERGHPSSFAPNQVIKGWTEAMQLMVEGDKWELYIPSELAYGERGSPPKIPGDSVLIFTIEILEIMGNKEGLPLAMRCNAATGDNCTAQDNKFLEKVANFSDEKKMIELSRLNNLLQDKGRVKPDLVQWIHRRSLLLKQLVGDEKAEKSNKENEVKAEEL